jgi:hypothetical protein
LTDRTVGETIPAVSPRFPPGIFIEEGEEDETEADFVCRPSKVD